MRRLLPLVLLLGCHEWSRDRSAAAFLKTIVAAQADFRENDRDEDGSGNFWVKDVAGLYGLDTGKGPMKLIHINDAQADRTPGGGRYPSVAKVEPQIGRYWYAALKSYRQDGKSVAYDDGTGRNLFRFALAAFPGDFYGEGSRLTFIVSERNIIYSKDTRGKPPEEFPEDPLKDGWQVFDRSR